MNGSRIGGLNWLFKLATAIREASASNEVTMSRERAGKMWLTWAKFFYLLSESQQTMSTVNKSKASIWTLDSEMNYQKNSEQQSVFASGSQEKNSD